jgi:hypothetical protein
MVVRLFTPLRVLVLLQQHQLGTLQQLKLLLLVVAEVVGDKLVLEVVALVLITEIMQFPFLIQVPML